MRHASKAYEGVFAEGQKSRPKGSETTDCCIRKPFVAFGKLVASLLDPISDRVRGNVILLGEVGGADVILQHLPHDPSALLRGEGGSTDGAAEKKRGLKIAPH